MLKIATLFLPVFMLVASSSLSAQYEEHETLPVDNYREQVDFSYPKNANIKIISNNGGGNDSAGHGEGDVQIDAEPSLKKMIAMSRNSDSGEMMEGYRVQIYAGGNLKDANETRADFIQEYSEIPSYRLWVQPTFRIRVGDFVNRNSANIFCSEIRKYFPGAFVVPDKVKKPKMKRVYNYEEIKNDFDGEDSPKN